MFAAEHAFQFGLVDFFLDNDEIVGHLGLGLGVTLLNRHLQQQVRLFYFRPGFLPAFNHVLELTKLFLDFAGRFPVRPEIRRQRLPLKPFNFLFLGG
jgi:hypothetical protein